MRKVAKLKVEADALGINLNIDGASEGILIEYEIVPKVFKTVLAEILDWQKNPGIRALRRSCCRG